MDTSKNIKYYNELDDEGQFDKAPTRPHSSERRNPGKVAPATEQFVQDQDDSSHTFSYKAASFEAGWLMDSLGYLYEQHWISDVIRKIKAGKEASVYLCRSGAHVQVPLLAVKVYRPRMLRNLKNDNLYREGRDALDEDGNRIVDLGMLKAQHKRSVYGEQIRHQSWIAYEYQTLQVLKDAGADVPRAYEMSPNAILMDYIGDEASAAPTLNSIQPEPAEVRQLFKRLVQNIQIMLGKNLVHGDLSAYNVLYWAGEVFLIDFPQVVSPRENRNSFVIFERDVTRLCEYFITLGLELEPSRLATDLWKANGFRLRPEVHPGLLDANDAGDRQLWRKNLERE